MSEPFVAEIRIFSFNFAPTGWAMCNGQILPISQNTALFSLIGTFYGGNGTSNFALPNLQGCVAVDQGQGIGLSPYLVGQAGGSQTVTLIQSQIPAHTHAAQCSNGSGNKQPAAGGVWAKELTGKTDYINAPDGASPMNTNALAPAGGDVPHDNMQPYLVMNYCIALQGVFPPRS
jgi:microcystin-dependent protein